MKANLDTVYSLSGDVPQLDASTEDSDEASLQRGSVARGSIRTICLIRKIGPAGAVLHSDLPVEEGERLDLELETGEQLGGIIAWRRGCEFSLRFDAPIDVLPILARNLVAQPGERRRMPRVEVLCQGLIEIGTATELVMIRDLAQGGAKVETPFPLKVEDKVIVTPEGLRPLQGSVRWVNDCLAGIAFTPELGWQELMPWLRARRTALPADFVPPPPSSQEHPEEGDHCRSADTVQLNLPAKVRDGTRRWQIDVSTLTPNGVEFDCFAALRMGTLIWIVLPGLEGWPARVVAIDGYRFACEFTQPLHPAVLERVLARGRTGAG